MLNQYAKATRHYVEKFDGTRLRWPALVDFDVDRTLAEVTDDIARVVRVCDNFTDKGTEGYDDFDLAYELAELVAFDLA